MTVAEFREWLADVDQGATVKVLVRVEGRNWQSDTFEWEDFDPSKHYCDYDLRGNPFVKPGDPHENANWIELGEA